MNQNSAKFGIQSICLTNDLNIKNSSPFYDSHDSVSVKSVIRG